MSASVVLPQPAASDDHHPSHARRLLVCWQDPTTRAYHAVGLLIATPNEYQFVYFRRAAGLPRFSPLVGFSDLHQRYRSSHLFPLFAQRVMDPVRPDRPQWLEALALAPDASPLEILAHSGGHRRGDTIELLPVPTIDPIGWSSCTFLVHGVRHCPGATERIEVMNSGERLVLRPDPNNEYNPRALLLASEDGVDLGYIPDPLLDHVHTVRDYGSPDIRVIRANGPDVGFHLRLLVRLEGRTPVGYDPLASTGWELAA